MVSAIYLCLNPAETRQYSLTESARGISASRYYWVFSILSEGFSVGLLAWPAIRHQSDRVLCLLCKLDLQ